MNASGPVAPPLMARDVLPKQLSTKALGLSGVVTFIKYLWRGYSPPGTRVAGSRPSGLASLHTMILTDSGDLTYITVRTASGGFTEEVEDKVDMGPMPWRSKVTYTRRTV